MFHIAHVTCSNKPGKVREKDMSSTFRVNVFVFIAIFMLILE